MHIWIINPFDELPGDTDIRHRYWALAETLTCPELADGACPELVEGAEQGHEVTWWSSDFSHRSKSYRSAKSCAFTRDASPFNIRLIHTSPYSRNVSLARLRNHRQFARRFRDTALQEIADGTIPAPDRIVVSLPPLGTAQAAFDIRAAIGGPAQCGIVLDIMDAWPETFKRAFPKPLRPLSNFLLSPLFRSARNACQQADRISAVANTYIDLAKSRSPDKPTHLCYHGIDLQPLDPNIVQSRVQSLASPVRLTYIGALEHSYDLETAIRAVHILKAEDIPVELHIAGAGSQEKHLRSLADHLYSYAFVPAHLRASPTVFHGLLGKDALTELLAESHFGLIPMTQDSCVGIPYILADYCAAGLPVLSSLDGECRQLLDTKKAGSFYEPSLELSLAESLKSYLNNPDRYAAHSQNALDIAQTLFDRSKTYPQLAQFVINT